MNAVKHDRELTSNGGVTAITPDGKTREMLAFNLIGGVSSALRVGEQFLIGSHSHSYVAFCPVKE